MTADDERSAKANLDWYNALRAGLQTRVRRPVDIFQEFVPIDRLATEEASLALRDYLRKRYEGQRVDVVVASAASVRDFVLRHRNELFRDTPLVVGGAWTPDLSPHQDGGGVAALELAGPVRETLAVALRLHPRTRRVYVLAGRNPAREPFLRQEFASLKAPVEFTVIARPTVPQMLETVRKAPSDSIVFYLNYVQNLPGHTLSELEVADLVGKASPVPVYGFLEAHVGLGLVGGLVLTARNEGGDLGTMAARVLNGERPQDIGVQRVTLAPIFDWRQLRRWSIDASALPPGADVRFRELTVWQRYRWAIVAALTVLTLQAALIAGLLIQRARRRQIALALHDTQERYALATAAGHVGVWEWDPAARHIYVDPAIRSLLGPVPAETHEPLDDWLAHVHAEDRAALVERLHDHAAGRTPLVELEHRVLHGDGTIGWVLVRGSIADDEGGRTRVVGTITDITERKRAELKLQEMQRELARVARVTALGEFATSIAHEVRQPLTAIISSARASLRFLGSGSTEEAREALSYVLDASKRADAIIERNRDLFRSRSVQHELLDCNAVVLEAARMVRPRLHGSQVSMETALLQHLPPVLGDRVELQQVLLNLIVNAADAMESVEPSRRRLKIASTLSAPELIEIAVADSGVGLEGVDLQRLFTFSYTTKPAGTGVGLSISRSIIEAHGGKLTARQNPTGGATFSFTLPAAGAGISRELAAG